MPTLAIVLGGGCGCAAQKKRERKVQAGFQAVLCGLYVTLGACALIPSAEDSAPIVVTPQDLRSNPWRYHDRQVQITGEFNECVNTGCAICDLTGVEKKNGEIYGNECIGISFGENDMQHAPGYMLSVARHTTSTIEATYNAFCANARAPVFMSSVKYQGKNRTTVCHHLEAELQAARLVKVHTRRLSREGFTRILFAQPLMEPGAEEKEKLFAAFDKSMSSALRRRLGVPDRWLKFAFVYPPEEGGESGAPEQTGGVCVCEVIFDSCKAGAWEPQVSSHIWNETEADEYNCYQAEKYDGAWKFTIFP